MNIHTSEDSKYLIDGSIYRVWCRYCKFSKEKSDFTLEWGKLVEKQTNFNATLRFDDTRSSEFKDILFSETSGGQSLGESPWYN